MPLRKIYTITTNGSMIFTGNTSGLSGPRQDGQQLGSIRAFTTPDLTKQVSGYPQGTTLVWQENESQAQLNIPPGSTVLYARLQWGGTEIAVGAGNVTSSINTSITFKTPLGTSTVSPDPLTSDSYSFTSAQGLNQYYSRSQDVTSIVQAAGSGTYSIKGVPGLVAPDVNATTAAGWTLGIIYKLDTLPYRNMTLYSGISGTFGSSVADINIYGFRAPSTGTVKGRVLVSAIEGDSGITGDQFLFGPTTSSLALLSGSNNLSTNFFASQINNGDSESATVGQLDKTGTFGNLNSTPGLYPAQGLRQGWDITNVSSTNFVNGQNTAVVRLATSGDAYAVSLLGIQLDSTKPAPFTCKRTGYRVWSTSSTANSSFGEMNIVTGNLVTLNSNLGFNINAIGYNPQDNLIYGMITGSNSLVVIDKDIAVINYGPIDNLPVGNYNVGAVNNNGYLFIRNSTTQTYYVIDVNQTSLNFGKLLDPTNGYVLDTSPHGTNLSSNITMEDWTFSSVDGKLYGFDNTNNKISRINPESGLVTPLTTTGVPTANYGSAYSISDGYVYIINNTNGNIYRITISGNNATGEFFAKSLAKTFDDATSCINATLQLDFGDAPDINTTNAKNDYTTLLKNNGPRHGIVDNLRLGNFITAEADAYQNSNATGDDINLNIQDDGIATPLPILTTVNNVYSVNVAVNNQTSIPANLYAWLDFNQNGIFETDEGFKTTVLSQVGTQTITMNFNRPNGYNSTSGQTFLRVRITTETLVNTGTSLTEDSRSIGPATDGEVEDYVLTVTVPSANLTTSSKGNNKTQAVVGEKVIYTITIPNTSLIPATSVYVYDKLTPGLQLVGGPTVSGASGGTGGNLTVLPGYNVGTISAGNTAKVTFEVLVTSIPSPSTYVNTATITYTDPIGVNTLPVIGPIGGTPITKPANLSTSSKGNNKTQAIFGEKILYTITIPNTGSVPATNVSIYDKLTPGLQIVGGPTVSGASGGTGGNLTVLPGYNIGTISAGSTATIAFEVLIVTIPTPSTYVNVATISYNDPLGTTTLSVLGPTGGTPIYNPPNLRGAIKGNNKTIAVVGEKINYSITIPNAGSIPVTNVYVYDKLTPGLQLVGGPTVSGASGGTGGSLTTSPGYNIGTILAGATASLSFEVLVTSIPTPSTYLNVATITYSDSVITDVFPVSGPSGGTPIYNPANLNSSSKGNNKTMAVVGEIIQYVVTIPNTGSIPATNVNVYDKLTPGLQIVGSPTVSGASGGTGGNLTVLPGYNIGTVLAGNTAVLKFDILVASIPNPSTYVNTATISYSDPLGNSTIPVSGPSGGTPIYNPANLSTSNKGNNKSMAVVGETVKYVVTIPNTGSIPATNVNVYDKLASGLQLVGTPTVSGASGGTGGNLAISPGYNVGTISAANTAVLKFDVLVVSIPNPSVYVNTATITYDDPLGAATIPVIGPSGGTPIYNPADITTSSKGNNKVEAVVGEVIEYTITIPNTGSIPASNVYVYDKLAQGLQVVGTPTVSGTSGGSGGNLTVLPGYNIGTILAGDIATIKFNILVASLPNPTTYVNTATLTYDDPLGNTTVSVSGPSGGTPIYNPANLTMSSKGNDKAQALVGEIIEYTITIPNTGSIPATNVNVYDKLTPGIELLGSPIVIGATGGTGGTLTTYPGYNVGTILSGSTAKLIFNVIVVSLPNPSTYMNLATITYNDLLGITTIPVSGPNGGTLISNPPDLSSSSKGNNKSNAVVGEIIEYTITIPNTGSIPASNVYVYDKLSPGLQVYGTPTVNGSSGGSGGNLTALPGYNVGSISPGDTASLKFDVIAVSIPTPSTYINIATITYNYPLGTNTIAISGPSDGTLILNPANLKSTTKDCSKSQAILGDVIEYVITIPNTGSIPATNVIVYDSLTSGLNLIAGPTVSGATGGIGGSLTTFPGYNIGTIMAGDVAKISFDVLISTMPNPSTYLNIATISYMGPLGATIFPVTGPTGGTKVYENNCYYIISRFKD